MKKGSETGFHTLSKTAKILHTPPSSSINIHTIISRTSTKAVLTTDRMRFTNLIPLLFHIFYILGLFSLSDVSSPLITFTPAEEEHIISVTVRIISALEDSFIFYSLDGSKPTLNSLSTASNSPIVIDKPGDNIVRAFAHVDGKTDSPIYEKHYHILDRCAKPVIFPDGGTFAGSIEVTLSSQTQGAILYYTLDQSTPLESSSVVPRNGIVSIQHTSTLKVFASKNGMAQSSVVSAVFNILPKVATPIIRPEASIFTISATITIYCSTENATIYFTTDGSKPTISSLTVNAAYPQLIIDTPGTHLVQAFATVPSMLASDVASKSYTILERAPAPQMIPASGSYVSSVDVKFACNNATMTGGIEEQGITYYTVDGKTTPSSTSPHVACNQYVHLSRPGKYIVRAYVEMAHRSPSSIVTGTYIVVRPAYDEFPVFPNATLQRRPQVDVFVVEKNIPFTSYKYCSDRNIRGRLVVLHNPVGHMNVLEPLNGCGNGLSLPSLSGRQNFLEMSHSKVPDGSDQNDFDYWSSASNFYQQQIQELSSSSVKVWQEEFETELSNGCEIVTNAGFFNVTSTACFGDIVSGGHVVQTSDKHNVNFGIRDGKFVVGYVQTHEILSGADNRKPGGSSDPKPFDTLISGLGWLVRGGETYVDESFHPQYGTPEDMSAQTSGSQFTTVQSARTAIGHDKDGRLLILQVEGETWVRGMSLYEFADFAREIGFVNAVNLDGGGSATITVNHTLVSEPSWKCQRVRDTESITHNGDIGHAGRVDTVIAGDGFRYCEKPVSSVICIHSMPPPQYKPPAPTPVPVHQKSKHPSTAPSVDAPGENDDDISTSQHYLRTHSPTPVPPPTTRVDNAQTSMNSTLQTAFLDLQSSEYFYRRLSVGLSFALTMSIMVHLVMCVRIEKGLHGTQPEYQHTPVTTNKPISPQSMRQDMSSTDNPFVRPQQQYHKEYEMSRLVDRHGSGGGSRASLEEDNEVDIHDPSWQPNMKNTDAAMSTLYGDKLLTDDSDSDGVHATNGHSINYSSRASSGPQLEEDEEDEEDVAETAQLVPKRDKEKASSGDDIHSSSSRRKKHRQQQQFLADEGAMRSGAIRKKKMSRDEEDFGAIPAVELKDSSSSSGSWFKKKKNKKKNFENDGL